MFQSTAWGRRFLRLTIGLLVMAGLSACESSEPPIHSPVSPDQQRLVSLSPAVTQMIIDLGRGDKIVGIGRFDPAAAHVSAPVVGDLYSLDYEKLLAVQPTDIFLQPHTQGVPQKLRDLAAERGWALHIYNIETIDNVKDAIFDEFGEGVGTVLDLPDAALELRKTIIRQMASIMAISLDHVAPRTLLLVTVNPLTAVGPNTFLDEMLNTAGGENVITSDANRYPVMDKEQIAALNPDVIIIISSSGSAAEEPAPSQTSDGANEIPGALAGLDIAAVRNGKVHWLIDEQAMLPTTTLPRITAKLAAILHPESADDFLEAVSNSPVDEQPAAPQTTTP